MKIQKDLEGFCRLLNSQGLSLRTIRMYAHPQPKGVNHESVSSGSSHRDARLDL